MLRKDKLAQKITHIIYDMDGLLLDTEPFYTIAAKEVTARFGKEFDPALKGQMMGRRAEVSARILVEALALPITPEEYLEMRGEILLKLFPTAKPRPGAKEITAKGKSLGIKQAVATSTSRDNYELKTGHHRDWFTTFDLIITGDDKELHRGKPAPDIFLLAAARLGAEPAQCLVFEDSPMGVEAAKAAGMKTVAIPDRSIGIEIGQFAEADLILNSLEEFNFSEWFPDIKIS